MKKTTRFTKKNEIKKSWYLIDAQNAILGRLAAKAASIIRGKHKTSFTPNVDSGDFVIVINAAKIRVTGNKLTEKKYLFYSGYPGGQKERSLEEMLKRKPEAVIHRAVRRMLPRRPLYVKALKKLKIFVGEKHDVPVKDIKTITI